MTREIKNQERLIVSGTGDFKFRARPPLGAAGGWLEGRQAQGHLLGRRKRPSSLLLVPLVTLSISVVCFSPTVLKHTCMGSDLMCVSELEDLV